MGVVALDRRVNDFRYRYSRGGCWLAQVDHCIGESRVMDFQPPKNPMHGFRVVARRKTLPQ